MSDKAVVAVAQQYRSNSSSTYVYLYAYWEGPHVALNLKDALVRAPNRWRSDALLSRVVFSEMIRGMEADTAHFGICGYLTDLNRPKVTVDCDAETVTIEGHSPLSFQAYIETSDSILLGLMGGCPEGPDCVICDRRRQRLEGQH